MTQSKFLELEATYFMIKASTARQKVVQTNEP